MNKVILCIDDSQRSNEVIKMFQDAGISYDISPTSADEVPFIRYGDDLYTSPGEIWLLFSALREIKEKEKSGIAPPRPDWKCKNCGHTMILRPTEKAPKICPKCKGTNILCFHMQKVY
jgi:hypothetical protein